MKLDVVPQRDPWFSKGLKFTCTQCGNCCTGGPGFVWISDVEIQRLAEFLKLTTAEVLKKYCRKVGGRWSLKERKTPEGLYDCVFLTGGEAEPAAKGRELSADAPVPVTPRGCAIYSVRPLQCRTWPFWESNLAVPEAWERAASRCPGMGEGDRHFTREKIESLRDAKDWPENPPGSGEV